MTAIAPASSTAIQAYQKALRLPRLATAKASGPSEENGAQEPERLRSNVSETGEPNLGQNLDVLA